jgi:hypothetical protein
MVEAAQATSGSGRLTAIRQFIQQACLVINGPAAGYLALAELALMDLAVRSTPAGSEGLGFSIMVSVRNLALFGTDWFGSNLLDQYHLSFNSLVIANSATTLIAVPLVLLLPRLIVIRKDAENRATTKRP